MKGADHSLSGFVAGGAYGICTHLPLPATVMLAGLTAGTAMLPDSDQWCSSAGRSLGFLSAGVARAIGHISGGHRHLTHSLAGVAAFTAWAWAGGHWLHHWEGRGALCLLLAIAFAAAAGSLGAPGHLGDAVAIGAAVGVTFYVPALALVPLATAIGCLAHIAGDALTKQGVPLLAPLPPKHFRLLPKALAFTTGTWRETVVVRGVLLAAIPVLIYHAMALPSWPAL